MLKNNLLWQERSPVQSVLKVEFVLLQIENNMAIHLQRETKGNNRQPYIKPLCLIWVRAVVGTRR